MNLKRKNYSKKVTYELEVNNGLRVTGKTQILAEIEHYYQNLYASESTATPNEFRQFTQNIEISNFSEENKAGLEGPLTFEECKEALGTDLVKSLNSAQSQFHSIQFNSQFNLVA